MATPPPLSVLLPVRNGEKHLNEALHSLGQQRFPDFEILAVDDGSEDATADILREHTRTEPRLRILTQKPRGIVSALEVARSRARGRLLARMDADDVVHPDRFKAQLDIMAADPRVVATGTGVRYFPRDRVKDGALRYESWINALTTHEAMVRDIFVECPIPHPTLILRADVAELLGGYREMGWPEDYDLILRIWEAGGRFGKAPEALLQWREGEGRLSRTHTAYDERAFRRCKVRYLLRTFLRGSRGVVLWGAGPVGKAFAREIQAQGGNLKAFLDPAPTKLGQEIHGARVWGLQEAGRFHGDFHLAAVAKAGGREEIRGALEGMGLVEHRDFLAVA